MKAQRKYNILALILFYAGLSLALGLVGALWWILKSGLIIVWALACFAASVWIGERTWNRWK